ncbi:TFIIE alpha subunit-domain-containing protein [Lipomyces oligophaga]|uniref:TFIIE alpha subunit-domain-containing protein n=1 Tax=Lipomyces oligophaga TaxID=45792 RepID=UPI0034CD0E54
MEHVNVLLQYVARSFYETRHIIILDAILRHNLISDDDLPQLVGIQKKELHSLCARLRDDCLLKVHTRSEPREGQQRPIQRTYYFVQYREAVDAVKWRIHKLGETYNEQMRNDIDTQGYACPLCKRRYNAMEVLPLQAADLSGFQCMDCGTILQDDDESDELRISQDRLSRLMSQIRRIIDTLKKIDDSFIPDNDFESSLKVAIPISLDSKDSKDVGYAARGVNDNKLLIEVDLSGADSEKSKAEAALAKQQTAINNALPVWYEKSTIGAEVGAEDGEERNREETLLADAKTDDGVGAEVLNAEPGTAEFDAVTEAVRKDILENYDSYFRESLSDEEEEDDDDAEDVQEQQQLEPSEQTDGRGRALPVVENQDGSKDATMEDENDEFEDVW